MHSASGCALDQGQDGVGPQSIASYSKVPKAHKAVHITCKEVGCSSQIPNAALYPSGRPASRSAPPPAL